MSINPTLHSDIHKLNTSLPSSCFPIIPTHVNSPPPPPTQSSSLLELIFNQPISIQKRLSIGLWLIFDPIQHSGTQPS